MSNSLRNSDPVWDEIASGVESKEEAELLRFLYQGLIFPKEDSLMLRCRMTGAQLSAYQLKGLAQIADEFGGGYLDITTRANFQIREIAVENGLEVLRKLLELEIVPATKGLNNLRNVTVTPTSGFDPHEVTDVIPVANSIINALLYQPALQGLPGKFNIAVDSGGMISVASEANDVGVKSVRENGELRYRMFFSNLKNQKTIAVDSGWSLREDQVVPVLSAVISLFIEQGDFQQRLKSRLKFYIASIGMDKFLELVGERVIYEIEKSSPPQAEETSAGFETAHLGVQEQSNSRYRFLGIQGTTGRVSAEQAREMARLSEEYGQGCIRLTTKQTLILPWIESKSVSEVTGLIAEKGLLVEGSFLGTIVACTGSIGCSYSATDTKLHAKKLRSLLDDKGVRGKGINIHFTGCPFSCAQAVIGDIGLLGRLSKGVECYDVYLGGGATRNIAAQKVSVRIPEVKLYGYITDLIQRYEDESECGESFHQYLGRVDYGAIFKND